MSGMSDMGEMNNMNKSNDIVIIGGGHAAAQLCASLVEAGQGARVHLVCEEPCEPYHRPPLSKAFLKSAEETTQPHKAADWYREAGIALHLGDAATAIDRAAHTVTLRSGAVLPWERLVLATGTRARRLEGLPDGLANVAMLRAADEAHRLRAQLASAQHVTVLGGGFIGLEVAATAKAMGKTVRVVEAAPRLMGRAVSPELSAHVLAVHRAADIDIVLNAKIGGFEISENRLQSMQIDGVEVAVDLLLLGIGAVPETALAEATGLECADGIVVDAHMQTSDSAADGRVDAARCGGPERVGPGHGASAWPRREPQCLFAVPFRRRSTGVRRVGQRAGRSHDEPQADGSRAQSRARGGGRCGGAVEVAAGLAAPPCVGSVTGVPPAPATPPARPRRLPLVWPARRPTLRSSGSTSAAPWS